MIPYKNFKAELLPAPVGVDLAIQKIQVHLASKLPWLQIAFGRCTKQIVRTSDKRYEGLESVPEVYLNREPISVMVNDNLKSYCFFNAKDPVNLDDEINANQDVDIIFWMNLKLIDPEKKIQLCRRIAPASSASAKVYRFQSYGVVYGI